ncbi:MAG: hypothetical protein KatS3mg131_1212 [Candidatus Tectimicrobiota bacterium]|nr:MAG: hypothetical protein KatS3mg131_1212 [Candidatus Tectomicrobia bacterium]
MRDFYGLVGRSAALRAVIRKIEVYGPTGAPVLITGETGTGKELAARALHACSPRREEPFVAVNCAALSSELLESELFGHERGAFTGAIRTHKGRFERAHRGTLFLDEIGELPVTTQAKLLRVLEEGVIERVGAEQPLPVDVRLIAATNVPLELAVERGTFRADLYHRLAVLRLHMPPLHERLEDLPLLVAYFLKQLQQKYGRPVRGLTPEAIALLQSYSWPGNVRELRNVLERVYVEATGEVIGRRAFEEWVEERWRFFPGAWNVATRRVASSPLVPPPPARAALPALSALSEAAAAEPATRVDRRPLAVRQAPLTRERIAAAFCQTGGNLTAAARRLGVHKATLYRHLKALGMTRTDLEAMAQAGTVPSESGHA